MKFFTRCLMICFVLTIVTTGYAEESVRLASGEWVPYHLLLSKTIARNQRLIALLNSGLRRLKDKGDFDRYIAESRRGDYQQ